MEEVLMVKPSLVTQAEVSLLCTEDVLPVH